MPLIAYGQAAIPCTEFAQLSCDFCLYLRTWFAFVLQSDLGRVGGCWRRAFAIGEEGFFQWRRVVETYLANRRLVWGGWRSTCVLLLVRLILPIQFCGHGRIARVLVVHREILDRIWRIRGSCTGVANECQVDDSWRTGRV